MPIPKLRFKAVDGNDFPEWEMKRLGDVCEYRKGQNVGANYVGTENMKQNFSGVDSLDSANEVKGVTYCPGDTLMSNIRPYLKKTWKADRNGVCSTDVLVFRPINIDRDFLYYNISSEKFVSYVMTGVKGSKMPRGDKKHIMEYDIPIPILPEQQKIAEFLSAIDAVLGKQKETVSVWEERKKGVMQKLFSQEVRFKADDRSDFPDWEEKKFGDICAPLTYGMNTAAVKYDGENKYIRITDIDDESHLYKNNELVSPEGELDDKYLVSENDILLARTGASVGKSYLYDKKDGKLYYAGFLIKAHVKSENSKFIFYQTLTDRYARWVQVTSMRSGQPGINANEYSEFMMYVPCLTEQQKIADCLSSLDEVIEKQKATLAAWEELKKGLLQQMFV